MTCRIACPPLRIQRPLTTKVNSFSSPTRSWIFGMQLATMLRCVELESTWHYYRSGHCVCGAQSTGPFYGQPDRNHLMARFAVAAENL